MNVDVLTTRVADGIAVTTLGSAKPIYVDTRRWATRSPRRWTLERNLFLKLCITEHALARMRSYEEKKIPSPPRSFEV